MPRLTHEIPWDKKKKGLPMRKRTVFPMMALLCATTLSVARTDSLLASLESGDGTMGRLFTDPGLYEELLKTMVDFGTLLEAVRENPEGYVPEVSVF